MLKEKENRLVVLGRRLLACDIVLILLVILRALFPGLSDSLAVSLPAGSFVLVIVLIELFYVFNIVIGIILTCKKSKGLGFGLIAYGAAFIILSFFGLAILLALHD